MRPRPACSAGGMKAPRSQRAAPIDLSRGTDRKRRTLVYHSLAPASRRPLWVSGKPRPSLCPRPRPCGSGGMRLRRLYSHSSLGAGAAGLPAEAKGEATRLLPQRMQRPLDLLGGRPHMPSRWRHPPQGPISWPAEFWPCQQEALPWPEQRGRSREPDPHPSLGQNPLTPLFPGTAIPSTDP